LDASLLRLAELEDGQVVLLDLGLDLGVELADEST
jgi:hypothetical protein